MSGPFGSSQWMYSSGGFYGFPIEQSLRFNDNDSAYLSRTPASTTNRKTWTYSVWAKVAKQDSYGMLLEASDGSGNNEVTIGIDGLNKLVFYSYIGGYQLALLSSANLIRDPSAWYHFVFVADTTQATASERARVYINGVRLTSFSTETYPSQNYDTYMNLTQPHSIGRNRQVGRYFDGYMAEANLIDGQALEPTEFGEFKSGVWVPKTYSGSYGTNGFHLTFADSGAIGDDTSGNTNDWTANNLAATDVLLDSPTNNFAVLNAVDKHSSSTLLEGNLWIHCSASGYQACRSTLAMPSGLWYAEATTTGDRLMAFGIYNVVPRITDLTSTFTNAYALFNNGVGTRGTRSNSVTTNSRTADAANDVFQCAFNADTGEVWLGRNNTWFGGGDPSAATSPTYTVADGLYAFFASGGNGSGQPLKINFGQSAFAYTEPTDFLPLNTANLPDPVIDPAKDESPSDYFNTVLYTGTGVARSVTGVGHQPDLVWIKARAGATESNQLFDAVRGATLSLSSNSTNAEIVNAQRLTSFDADGFSVGTSSGVNTSGVSYVAWNWLAGNGTSSNTDGSITSTVSVNQKAGFSIVGYTGTGAAATVGHGLGAVPNVIIVKNRDLGVNNWWVYHSANTSAPETDFLSINTTAATSDNNNVWNDTAPTSSVFTVGSANNGNANGTDIIAYCFAEVEGYSKFGKYTGNGSTDGPFVYCGFRPAWVMWKQSNTLRNWLATDAVRSPYNVGNAVLYPNSSSAEVSSGTGAIVDYYSNGFKLRNSGTEINQSGGTYIFMAFAENPFKYANAR